MNIESLKSASPPQRVAPPETMPKVSRPAVDTSKAAIPENTVGTTSNLPPGDAQNRNKPAALSIEDAVKRLSDFVAPTQSQINFSIDEESGVRVVKILDSVSKEVIRQFPSEEAIEIARALDKLQGLLIKDKA